MVESGVFDFKEKGSSLSYGIKKIRKRDGKLLDFDFMKVSDAIFKALKAVDRGDLKEEDERALADELAKKVIALAEKNTKSPMLRKSGLC